MRSELRRATVEPYSILTAEMNGTEELVDAPFEYGVALDPDGRLRFTHFAGVHV